MSVRDGRLGSGEIRVFETAGDLAYAVAELTVETLAAAIAARGTASLVLAGGATPAESYRNLARRQVDWAAVDVYWGDERCVGPDDPRSNFRMARETLLDPADVPPESVHRVAGERGAVVAASEYERLLRSRFHGPWPRLDLVLLGVGGDGHVASLFPEEAPMRGEEWVVPVRREPPEIDRVSLSMGTLRAARRLLVLATGEAKAGIVERALLVKDGRLPIVELTADLDSVVWLIDGRAAGRTPEV